MPNFHTISIVVVSIVSMVGGLIGLSQAIENAQQDDSMSAAFIALVSLGIIGCVCNVFGTYFNMF